MSHKSKKHKGPRLYAPQAYPGFVSSAMSHKSKKHKGPRVYAPQAYPVPSSHFDEIQRQAERHAAQHEELRYRIAPDCKVHLQFNGLATQEAIKKLINYLEMGISDFPEDTH